MDSSRKLVILLVAGVIVAFLAIAIRSRLSSEPEVQASANIIIAKRDVSLGTLINSAADLDYAPAPEGANPEEVLPQATNRIEDFNGAVARKPLKAGEVIVKSSLMKSGEGGFMSAVLEPGKRAISVAVNATSGNAGFISPGDRVDLIVTHRIRSGNRDQGGQDSVVSETFVRNVRVLAVDQMLDNPDNKAILAKTVTVEVSDGQAEQIAVATEMGKISMALRSASNEPVAKNSGDTVTTESDVSKIMGGGVVPRIRVIRGDDVQNMEFGQ